jgi:hypothetical protein
VGQINDTECKAAGGRHFHWTAADMGDWTEGDNWDQDKVPIRTSIVHLGMENTTSILPAGKELEISGLQIKNGHHLKVGPDNKLTVSYVEITCFGVNWCHGKGKCIDVDTCLCDEGYSGKSCKERSINLVVQPLQNGMSVAYTDPKAGSLNP